MPQLTAQQHQGLHGEGFIFALASSAGLTLAKFNVDVDGIDWLIAHPGHLGDPRSPKIEVQVKSWSNPKGDADSWHYRLSVKHFNGLAGSDWALRRYLMLVIAPKDPSQYAAVGDALELRHRAYWTTLADRKVLPEGPRDPKTIAVPVPKRNLLTVDSLKFLVLGDQSGVTS